MVEHKKGRKLNAVYLIALANLLLSLFTYPLLPDTIIIHWGAAGNPDGYSSKLVGVAVMQVAQLVILGIYWAIPRIDPQEKIKTSTGYFNSIMSLLLLYFMYFNGLFIAQNLGYSFNLLTMLLPSVGVMFYFIGNMLSKAEQNWFVGIRTPWTLSSEEVWRATHERGGMLFKISGLISVLGALLPEYVLWFLFVPITFTTLYLIVFSYLEFNKKSGKPESKESIV